MKIRFTVEDIPPKKDGANSMWRKPTEIPRLIALRKAAFETITAQQLTFTRSDIELQLHIYAPVKAGDLDNFITGICDGLMAAKAAISDEQWSQLPAAAHPNYPLIFVDDSQVQRIEAERHPPQTHHYYTVQIIFRNLPLTQA